MNARPALQMMVIQTSWGGLRLQLRHDRVCSLDFPYVPVMPDTPFNWQDCHVQEVDGVPDAIICAWEEYIRNVFAGQPAIPPAYESPDGSHFSLQVWQALQRIPVGHVESYGSLARQLGRPGAARAVGRACGANPLPIIIPCHRVVAANGSLGGFSCGLAWKQLLLAVEQHEFAASEINFYRG